MDISLHFSQIIRGIEEGRDIFFAEPGDDGTIIEYRINTSIVDPWHSDEDILTNLKVYWAKRLDEKLIKGMTKDIITGLLPNMDKDVDKLVDMLARFVSSLSLRGDDKSDDIHEVPLLTLLPKEQRKLLLDVIHEVRLRKLRQMLVNGVKSADFLMKWSRILRRKTKIPRIAPWQFMSSAHYKRYIMLRFFMRRYRSRIKYYVSQSYHVYLVDTLGFPGFFVIGKDDSGKYFCDAVDSTYSVISDFKRRYKQFFIDDKVVKREIYGYSEELRGRVLDINPDGYRVQGDLKVRVLDANNVKIRLVREGWIAEYVVNKLAERHEDVRKRIETDMLREINREFFGLGTRVYDVISYIEKKYKLEALSLLERRVRLTVSVQFGNKHEIIVEKGVPIQRSDSIIPDILTLRRTKVIIRHKEHGVKKLIAPANVILRFYLNKFFDLGLERY